VISVFKIRNRSIKPIKNVRGIDDTRRFQEFWFEEETTR